MTSHTDGFTLLCETLAVIAQRAAPDERLPRLLHLAQRAMGAQAGWLVVFEPTPVTYTNGINPQDLPPPDQLQVWAATAPGEIFIDGTASLPAVIAQVYHSIIYAPIRHKERVVALLGLLFSDDPASLMGDHDNLLTAIVDGIMVVLTETRTTERNQRLMRNQGEFVRITTHDLRSPLTVLKGIISMMESGTVDLTKIMPDYVGKMASAVHQMEMQVDNIQDAGRYDIETGFYELQRSPTDLIELVHKIVKNQLRPAEKQALTISVEAADDVPIVNIDANMLERAITNLVDNAIKYTPNGGAITVRVYRMDESITISVRDTGLGISAENLPHLFNRYYRVRRREYSRVKGTGLGLFIVRSAAQQHGGDARVESIEGQGTTFFIDIPLTGANILNAPVDA